MLIHTDNLEITKQFNFPMIVAYSVRLYRVFIPTRIY